MATLSDDLSTEGRRLVWSVLAVSVNALRSSRETISSVSSSVAAH